MTTLSPKQIEVVRHWLTTYVNRKVNIPAKFIELFSIRKLSKGELYLTDGETWNTFAIIAKGLFRLYYIDEAGNEHTKGFFTEGQILAPHVPSAVDTAVNFYIDSFEPSEVLSADYWKIREHLDSRDWGKSIRISMLENLLEEKIEREYCWLMLDAETRYLRFIENHPDIAKRLPLYIIANYLGMTDVTLSRIRKKIKLS